MISNAAGIRRKSGIADKSMNPAINPVTVQPNTS